MKKGVMVQWWIWSAVVFAINAANGDVLKTGEDDHTEA